MVEAPTGTVTFLFTDVEGSTAQWAGDPEGMSASLSVHDDLVRSSIETNGGYVFTTAGDAFCAAFDRASDGVAAAEEAQERLARASWPGPELRVRMALHLGEAVERGGDYFGNVVNITARVEAAAHGGQVLLTAPVTASTRLPVKALGVHTLRDVAEPIELWQLGQQEFPQLRSESEQSNLPFPATRLLGRADDIHRVRQLLSEHRLVTVAAGGGTGKTRLAIEVGDQEVPHFPAGVWFVDLTEVAEEQQVAPAVAKTVGFELQSGDQITETAGFVGRQRMLVILDNCEHVIDTCAAFAAAMLKGGGKSRLLTTSREWLDIEGEHTHQLSPLDSHHTDSAAVRLFAERASSVDDSFQLDDQNASDVVALCQRLDGVPFAIELAASRSVVLSPGELLTGLDDRFALLSGGRRRRRHRALEATLDWSYDLLPLEEQRVFAALGVFSGAFDLDAVASVCQLPTAASVDMVESLLSKSLVVNLGGGRFRLLETVKAYAEKKMLDGGQATSVRDLHFVHYAELFGFPDLIASSDVRGARDLMSDGPNGLAAADWAENNGDWSNLARLLVGLSALMTVSGDPHGSLARLRRCEEALRDEALKSRIRHSQIFHLMQLAHWAEYVDLARLLCDSADPHVAAAGYFARSLLFARHDPDRAIALIDEGAALRAQSELDDQSMEELAYRSYVVIQQGDLATAEQLANEVIEAGAAIGVFNLGVGLAHWTIAVAAWVRGDFDEVRRRARPEPTVHDASMRDPLGLSGIALFTTLAELGDGDPERRERLVREFALVANTGRMALEANDAVTLLAILSLADGDPDTARRLIMATGSLRSPTSTAIAQETARRLGVADELHEAYLQHSRDPDWLAERPKRILAAEIEKRGWTTPHA